MKSSCTTLVLRGPAKSPLANATANVSTGLLKSTTHPIANSRFVIEVQSAGSGIGGGVQMDGDEALTRLVRNCLSAYPIVDIEDGGGLPFDLEQWKRDHKKML